MVIGIEYAASMSGTRRLMTNGPSKGFLVHMPDRDYKRIWYMAPIMLWLIWSLGVEPRGVPLCSTVEVEKELK